MPGIERIRLGSLDPDMLHDDDIRRMAAVKKLCPQFHLSLQSGCDKTPPLYHRPVCRYCCQAASGVRRGKRQLYH